MARNLALTKEPFSGYYPFGQASNESGIREATDKLEKWRKY
jgi:hypothetical protein